MSAEDPGRSERAAAVAAARRSRRIATAVVTVVVLGLLAVAVVWLRGDSGEAEGITPGGAVPGVVQIADPVDRVTPEDFSARLLDETTFDSTDLRGTVAVYNVWGSWCGPCRTEAPALRRVAAEFEGRVRFVGINVRDNVGAAQAFERAFRIPYPSIHPDDSSIALLAFRDQLASAAVPSTVVLDARGRVAARVVGPVSYLTLKNLVEDAGA